MFGDFDEDEFDDDEFDDDDPTEFCPDCGCHLFTENHELDCWLDDNDDEEMDDDDDYDDADDFN